MKCDEHDLRLIETIKAIRKARRIKQSTLAAALGIDTSEYSRFECGLRALTTQHIRVLSAELNVSEFLIYFISTTDLKFETQNHTLSSLLLEFICLIENSCPRRTLSEEQLEYFFEKIRKRNRLFSVAKKQTS